MRRAVPLLAALALLAGCASLAGCAETTAGSATAGDRDPATGGPSTTGSATTGPEKPTSGSKAPVNRPKAIDVKGVDPCATLTEAQRAQFAAVRPRPDTSSVFGAPTCDFFRDDRKWGFRVTAVTTTGVEWYTDGGFDVEPEALQVGGFPAVLGRAPAEDQVCFLGVDVSDGQMVDVQVSSFEGVPSDELCLLAPQIAGAVVETLVNA
jgi:hypothetical protein